MDIAAYKTFVSTSATTEANGQYTDKVTDALGNVTDTNWDANKGLLTSSIDAKNVTTSYTYNSGNDKLTAVSSGGAIVDYGYTGDQLSTITRNGFSYGFTFDSLGNPTSVKMGTTPLITHSYQARTSLLLSSLYANGGKVSYDYDSLDRVIGVKIGSATSPQFEYRYDASGNLAIVKDNLRNITTYLEYDLANRLSKITDSQGNSTTYGFDAKNRLSGVTEVLKGTTYTSSYTYNADNQPATVIADGKTHSYTYDLLGRLSGTSLNTTTPYTTALTYKTNSSTGSSSHVLASYRSGSTTTTYQVDANGNITQLSDGTDTATYVYDDFNQLKRENNQWLNKSITYDYDFGGNLLAVKEYAYTTGTLGSPTSTVVYTYGSAWKDQLTKIGNDDLTYDANGNLLSYKTRSYSWQAGRQLAQITDTNLNAVYTYNESGIRTRKVVNGVTTDYILEGGKVILETTGSDTLHYSYDSRGQLVSFKLNGTPYFYTRNGQGDITGLIDASGVEVVRHTYDSWGKPISITGSLATTVGAKNPYRYRGYRYDNESGLYYLQSRYYDPFIKRFISADSVIADVGGDIRGNNLYSYCFNNPINMSDSNGYWPREVTYRIYEISNYLAEYGPPVLRGYARKFSEGAALTFYVQNWHFDRQLLNTNLPSNSQKANISGWMNSKDYDAIRNPNGGGPGADLHQFSSKDKSNIKYVSPDGKREIIFNESGEPVLDPRDIGTYNYWPSGGGILNDIMHGLLDVLPWIVFGNNDDDPGPLLNWILK